MIVENLYVGSKWLIETMLNNMNDLNANCGHLKVEEEYNYFYFLLFTFYVFFSKGGVFRDTRTMETSHETH